MKKIIIFGAGFYGKCAYYKLKGHFEILCYADNDWNRTGDTIHGLPVMAGSELEDLQGKEEADVVICTRYYDEIASQLIGMGIRDYYVMMEGFLYHNSEKDAMMPVELQNIRRFIKRDGEKNILFVQNTACIRTHKMAALMREEGYKVYLLYTVAPPEFNNAEFAGIYEEIFTFSTSSGIVDFVDQSEFDIIHCSNEPDILACLLLLTHKHVVFDTHDMVSLRGMDCDNDELTLEYMANTACDGNIYTSDGVRGIAEHKYGAEGRENLTWPNLVLQQETVKTPYPKLSSMDHEIHCVYEGGITGGDPESHRYLEKIWEHITACEIHIHFYSQTDETYCRKLSESSPFLHYEGNMGSKKLIPEMTKYDCGLAMMNVNEKNRTFLETASANKLYEYLNSGLPVIVGDVSSSRKFVKQYGVGICLDLNGDIRKQIESVCAVTIDENFLTRNGLTMKSRAKELVSFYERVKQREVKR